MWCGSEERRQSFFLGSTWLLRGGVKKWNAGSSALNDAGFSAIGALYMSAGRNCDRFRLSPCWRCHQRRSDQGLADGLAGLEADGGGHGALITASGFANPNSGRKKNG